MVRRHVSAQMSGQVSQLSARLRQYQSEPTFWANDVRQVLSILEEALPRGLCAIPADLGGPTGNGATEKLRRLVARLGELLEFWPDMVEAARDLRGRGVRPATQP
jgi:hypothetical protein